MSRLWLAVALTLALGASPARAQSWNDLGGYLTQACKVGSNGAGAGWLNYDGTSNLDWLCTLSSLYRFTNTNILNGDWTGFASEVIGRYVTDLAHYTTGQLGFGDLNKTIEGFADSLRGTYAQFKASMLGAMRNSLRADGSRRLDDNAGLNSATPGGLADAYAKQNPLLNAAQTAGRLGQTVDRFEVLDRAFRAKKLEEESQKAIADNVAPAMANATGMIGTPQAPGTADTLLKKAQTALSSREVAEIQVEAVTTGLKQSAVMNTAVLNQLSEIAKQQVMTNNQLLLERGQAEEEQAGVQNQMKTYLESVAQDTLASGREAATAITDTADIATFLLDPSDTTVDDVMELAP